MSEYITEKYRVKNIDCANCAAKIEHGLQQLDGVAFAAFDFTNQMLHVQLTDPQKILDHVRKIEPNAELVPQSNASSLTKTELPTHPFPFAREAGVLGAAMLLFLGVLYFEYVSPDSSVQHLLLGCVAIAYLLAGWNVIRGAARTIRRGYFFDENVLMVIATGGAIAIQAYSEAVGVMIFYKVGELLQNLAVSKSRRSIQALLAAKPDKAYVQTAGGFREMSPESVKVGSIVLVRPGEKIPLDGEVIDGNSQIDTSALTGESVPVFARPGDTVMAGQVNRTGALTFKSTQPFASSSIAKMMDLVENAAARKAKTEKFITTFARHYTPAVVLLAACIAFLPPLITEDPFRIWIYRALVLLVISCPCALVVSIPLGYFGGIGRASRSGILVKGSNFIDALCAVKTVVFDKTGTLTQGVFNVLDVVNKNGYSKDQVLELAAAAEYQSNHPIAASILKAFEQQGGKLNPAELRDHTDYSGRGVSVRYGDHTIMVGNDSLLHLESVDHQRCEFDSTVAHLVVDGEYAGYILIGDELKPDAESAVRALKAQGVDHVAMLTGDNSCAAEAVSNRLKLNSYHADLLPEEKVHFVEKLIDQNGHAGKVAYVGDGINDAPVIARADVGVAMGALGSDAAIESADVVLMTDSPTKMVEALSIAKQTRRIVWQNIVLAFIVKGVFIGFGAFGLATMWEAVFADMGTALVAVTNSTRIIGRRN